MKTTTPASPTAAQSAPELERLATRLSAQFTKEMVRDKDATIYALTLSTLEAHPDVVLAVNSHAALVASLEEMTDDFADAMRNAGVTHYPEALANVRQARAALALAKGGAS